MCSRTPHHGRRRPPGCLLAAPKVRDVRKDGVRGGGRDGSPWPHSPGPHTPGHVRRDCSPSGPAARGR